MPRDYRGYLDDILEAAGRIRRYTAGLSLEALRDDTKTLDAVAEHCLALKATDSRGNTTASKQVLVVDE